jgi:hypothetical protein
MKASWKAADLTMRLEKVCGPSFHSEKIALVEKSLMELAV